MREPASVSTFVHDPDQPGNRMGKYGGTEHSITFNVLACRPDLPNTEFSANLTGCYTRPHARSWQRLWLGQTRVSSHSIFRGLFRRSRGLTAGNRNLSLNYDLHSW